MAPTDPSLRPIVISGPSGAGKSTLVNRLLNLYPQKFGFSISHTTRSPRGTEQNGKEYHFVSRAEFQSLIDAGGFIEHAQFGSNLYGTSVKAVKDVAGEGKVCILDIEMEGVKQVAKRADLGARFLFVKPPGLEVLEQRLRGRGTDKEADVVQRLQQARKELAFVESEEGRGIFEKVIVNEELERAWGEFLEFCVPEGEREGKA